MQQRHIFSWPGLYAFLWRVVLTIWTILVPSCLRRDRSSSPSEVRCMTCKMVVSCSRAILGYLCLTNRRDQLDLGVDLWYGSCILPNGFGVRAAVSWLHAPGRRDCNLTPQTQSGALQHRNVEPLKTSATLWNLFFGTVTNPKAL